MLLLMTSLEARMNREPTMTVVPAKMIMGENEPRSRTRRAPAVGPPSSDLNANQQSPSTIMGVGTDQDKNKNKLHAQLSAYD